MAPLKLGARELRDSLLKGAGALSVMCVRSVALRKLGGRLIKRHLQLAAVEVATTSAAKQVALQVCFVT